MKRKMTNKDIKSLVLFLKNTSFLEDINTKVSRINSGGCGIFAKHLYLVLTKMGFEVSLYCSTALEDKKGFKYLARNNEFSSKDRFAGFNHIMVRLAKNVYIDSEGVFRGMNNERWIEPFEVEHRGILTSIEALEVAVNKRSLWNEKFKRINEGTIKRELKKLPKKYEKYLVGEKV